jgi:hypothetical protein
VRKNDEGNNLEGQNLNQMHSKQQREVAELCKRRQQQERLAKYDKKAKRARRSRSAWRRRLNREGRSEGGYKACQMEGSYSKTQGTTPERKILCGVIRDTPNAF